MSDWSYAKGDLPAIAGESLIVVLSGTGAEEWARLLLPLVPVASSADDLLEHFASTGDVAALPAFFIGTAQGSTLRCIVRGAFTVSTRTTHGETLTVEGSSARTWSEIVIEDVVTSTVSLPGSVPTSPARPLRLGPLSVSTLRFEPTVADVPAPQAQPTAETIAPVEVGQTLAPTSSFEPTQSFEPAEVFELVEPAPPAPAPSAVAGTYDSLFGQVTIVGSIEDAAVRELLAESASHGQSAAEPAAEPASGLDPNVDFDASAVAVSAIVCRQQHANPPERATCWRCSDALVGGSVVRVQRPTLGELVFIDGRTVPVNRTILIGRSPRPDRTDAAGIPELVVVDSPNNDVSRTHARIFLDGWQVLLEDLGSTNGTVITTRDGLTRRIRAGEPAILVDGARVDLGDGALFSVVGVP